ncbi:CoA-transferase family III domain-containing protein [Gongronella butleri]|nr:CoA-transferase family III domain-containing protein [Gongronella butleri]
MTYSVPQASKTVLEQGILSNDKLQVPEYIRSAAAKVTFKGTEAPSIPINWRLAESISALKAYEGAAIAALVSEKYNVPVPSITIDTDHAQLGIMSPLLIRFHEVGDDGKPQTVYFGHPGLGKALHKHFKHKEYAGSFGQNTWKDLATNIYRTKDGRYYHVHGSMNCAPIQELLGVPHVPPKDDITLAEGWPIYQEAAAKFDAETLDARVNDKFGQAGSISYSVEEYQATEHYKANADVHLFKPHHIDDGTPAAWWHLADKGSVARPLAGLKVLDLTRVIAAPAITRTLAEYGASVMRITSPKLPDMSTLHADLQWGKWNCELDLRDETQRKQMLALLEEADVVVTGYRPFHLDKYGLGKDDLLALARRRGRGIIYLRENCYGWAGPWQHRIGWQQVSDSVCGISRGFADALGSKGEAVTPVFPNSDFCTGAAGATAVIQCLIDRAQQGGSYVIDVALNYYNQWLAEQVGSYDPHQWQTLWETKGKPTAHHYDNMPSLMPKFLAILRDHSAHLFNPDFFETVPLLSDGVKLTMVRPIVHFDENDVQPGYNVKTRGNGTDAPYWPKDLTTQVVTVADA